MGLGEGFSGVVLRPGWCWSFLGGKKEPGKPLYAPRGCSAFPARRPELRSLPWQVSAEWLLTGLVPSTVQIPLLPSGGS